MAKVVWTPEVEERVLRTLELVGSHMDLAARAAGIVPQTLTVRCQQDEEFAERVQRARAAGVAAALGQIRSAARNRKPDSQPGDWRAAEAWLRLVDPERFATRVEVTPERIAQIREEALREFVAVLDAAGVAPDVRRAVAVHVVEIRSGRVGGSRAGDRPAGRPELAG